MSLIEWIFRKQPKAYYIDKSFDQMMPFTGEKTPGELSAPIAIYPHYDSLRMRSWQSFLTTDTVQNSIKKYVLWVAGAGLKLQVTEESGMTDAEKLTFKETVEARFRLFTQSKAFTYNQEHTINQLSSEALKTAIISGDVLCVMRYSRGIITLQVIDGYFVRTPVFEQNSNYLKTAEERGNTITHGVEKTSKGIVVAYYIYESFGTYKRIRAKNTGSTITYAWLFKGSDFKLTSTRGLGMLAAILSSTKKMDRYKEATIGAAEENAKIPYTIEHGKDSDGENPLINQLAQSLAKGNPTAPETGATCDSLATKIAQTTEKMVYNMPVDSTLKRNTSSVDPDFASFYTINMNIIYATLGIPPEVAMDKYNSNYSASRAALKSWEYKMMIDRIKLLRDQFYKPIYDFWLTIEILEGNIPAPGFLEAYNNKDYMMLESYKSCRLIGPSVPHIDPEKEIKAERLKLGPEYERVPLTTAEQSMELMNTGYYFDQLPKNKSELDYAESNLNMEETNDGNSN